MRAVAVIFDDEQATWVTVYERKPPGKRGNAAGEIQEEAVV
jgi:hypothetical protein